MRLLYPSSSLDAKQVDEVFRDEFEAACTAGLAMSIFSLEDFERDNFRPRPAFQAGDSILYRGWMLTIPGYEKLVRAWESANARAYTSIDAYQLCHHLPSWYSALAEFTAETVVLSADADFASALAERQWPGYFVKDYVKSLSTGIGSLVSNAGEIAKVVALMKKYRGFVEGGVCVRRKETYRPGSEARFFVLDGHAFSTDGEVPQLVSHVASVIQSPFFSVDIAVRDDGALRVIEIGDGQVSDRKEWSAEIFVRMLDGNR